MDDEPPEVQQYKTCAKCRIIERTKKKLRKPLAEETMRYGMRQFQEQNQDGADYINDDIFVDDPVPPRIRTQNYSGAPGEQYPQNSYSGNYGGQGYAQNGSNAATPSFQQPGVNGPKSAFQHSGTDPNFGAQNVPAVVGVNIPGTGHASSNTLSKQGQFRHYQQRQIADRARLAPPTQCELCACTLSADDSTSRMYRLCKLCYLDPYSRGSTHSDFTSFLVELVQAKDKPLLVYILELSPELVELLNTYRQIGSEEHFRRYMLESLTLIYLEPCMASLAPLKFNRTSHNIHEVNHMSPIISSFSQQFHYTLTPPIRATHASNSEEGVTTIDMTFITDVNLIILRRIFKKVAAEYTPSFLKKLDEQMKLSGLLFQNEPSYIHSKLSLSVDLASFAKDFKRLQTLVTAMNNSGKGHATNGGREEEDDEDEEDDDDDEDLEDHVKMSETGEYHPRRSTRTRTNVSLAEDEEDEADEFGDDVDDLDPAFAP